MRTLKQSLALSSLLLSLPLFSSSALAQEAAPAAAAPVPQATSPGAPVPVAAPPSAPPPPAKKGSGPALGLSPDAPGQGGAAVIAPSEATPTTTEEAPTGEWKFDVTGYFRAPLRMSWGPPTTMAPGGGNAGTQYRTPPLVPDANYIDWRYTNSFVGPWTELNFHYGNDRVKSTVQIASYNLTDSGYRRLESNLGINEAFLTMTFPEFINENGRLTILAGGFTNRYGAAGRYDAGKYETYIFGRTHIVGETATLDYDIGDWTVEGEEGFGGKLEPIPFYGPPEGPAANGGNANEDLPVWEPYPGIVPQESTFVAHGHIGAVYKKELILGAHYIDVFANDNERAGSYTGAPWGGSAPMTMARAATDPHPNITIWGFDAKLIGGVLGEGYVGFSHLSATNAMYIADAIEVLHSFGGWQLHDNYFGPPGTNQPVTGDISTISGQYSFSLGQYFHYPQAFWGDGPDLIATVFGMYNHVHSPEGAGGAPLNPLAHLDSDGSGHIDKLKFGAEVTYIPLPWLGVGARFDAVRPDMDDSTQSFSVISPRVIFRTAFVTHEQVMLQYSHYSYGSAFLPGGSLGGSQFPYNAQPGAAGLGVDKNAAQIAAIIWF